MRHSLGGGILVMENLRENSDIIDELAVAYGMELETAQNYIANSVHLDGVRSEVIKKALAADVAVEVQHAQQIAQEQRHATQ